MRTLTAVLLGVWLLLVPQISSAHDPFLVKPDNGIEISILTDLLESVVKTFSLPKDSGGYLPTKDELSKIFETFTYKGMVFDGGFVLQIGGEKKYDPVFYFFIFGSGFIQWSFEEWVELSSSRGFAFFRWKFTPNTAFRTVTIHPKGGSLEDIFYDREISKDDPNAVTKSRIILNKILSAGADNK